MTKKIAQDIEDKIIHMMLSGKSYHIIAHELNIGRNTVIRTLKRRNIEPLGIQLVVRNFKDKEEEIIKLYKNGATFKDIRNQFENITDYIIRKILKKYQIKTRGLGANKRIWTTEIKEDILNKYNNGISQMKIAKIYKTNQCTISNILKNLGIRTLNLTGNKNGNWKGGRVIREYIFVKVELNSPFTCMVGSSGYIPEHRLIMAQYLNRPLTKKEQVHHINGNKHDNRIENLQLRQGNHGNGQVYKCNCCGSTDITAVAL